MDPEKKKTIKFSGTYTSRGDLTAELNSVRLYCSTLELVVLDVWEPLL